MRNLLPRMIVLIILLASGACSPQTPTPKPQAPPTRPENLVATFVVSNQVNLTWSASTDDFGVAGYQIYRNSSQIATSPTSSYSDQSAPENAIISYYVVAFDADGNISLPSKVAWVYVPPPTASSSSTLDLSAPCPTIPSMPDYGPPAPRQNEYSISFDLTSSYIQSKIKDAFETPKTDKNNDGIFDTPKIDTDNDGVLDKESGYGVDVKGVKLFEKMINGEHLNLIDVRIQNWLALQGLKTLPIGDIYTVRLKIVPYIRSSDVLLAFELYELTKPGQYRDEVVDCKKFVDGDLEDHISSLVLQGIYDGLKDQKPTTIPGKPFEEMVSGLACDPNSADCAALIKGVSIGTKESLKIGLLMDKGSPKPFISNEFTVTPDTDWGITIDTELIRTSIERKIIAELAKMEPRATVQTPVNVEFNEDGLDINFKADLGYCFGAKLFSSVHVTPRIVKNADGQSILVSITSEPTKDLCCSYAQKACLLADAIWGEMSGFFEHFPFGWAEATISSGCGSFMGEADFEDDNKTERFYGTIIQTQGTFQIFGRSTYMDAIMKRSPSTLPPSC